MSDVYFFSCPNFTEHITGPNHPERPDRIRAIHRAVREAGLIRTGDPFPEFKMNFGLEPVAGLTIHDCSAGPASEEWLALCHTPAMIERVKRVCAVGGGVLDQGDTPVGRQSFKIAMLGLGNLLAACDTVMERAGRRAFAAIRPPGHHAEPDRSMGFCLFSNVAIAAKYIQQQYNIERVAIVDFDVHHGNGTQACLEHDPTALFISLHQHPKTCYPGSGHDWETGAGPGDGYTLNIPFNPGAGDDEYLAAYHERVLPELDLFKPQVLLISAGFDAHSDDPLAQMNLTDDCFEMMTRLLVESANRYCEGRVISALEGGYNLRALGRSVVRHLVGLAS